MIIEKNINPPQSKGWTDNLRKLEIGDSFLCSQEDRAKYIPCSFQIGIKLKTKKQEDGMIRIWRIA